MHGRIQGEFRVLRGTAYLSPNASEKALGDVDKFLNKHAKGNFRWGKLYQYTMLEFDELADLVQVRERFARMIEGYIEHTDE